MEQAIDETMNSDQKPIKLTLRGTGRSSSPAKKWVDNIYSTLPMNPLDNRQVAMLFGEGEDQQIAIFEIRPSMHDPNTANVVWFQAYPQKQGVGTKAMRKLQDMAREDGIKLELTAWKHGKVPERVLNRFYKNMGFKSGKSREGMVWDPKLGESSNFDPAREAMENAINSFNEDQPYDALEYLIDGGLTVKNNQEVNDLLKANLPKVSNLLIREIRNRDLDSHVFERIRDMLDSIGVDIPNDYLAARLYDNSHLIVREFARMMQRGEFIQAVESMLEFNEWGLGLEMQDFVDFDEDKTLVIKSMLKAVKMNQISTVERIVDALRDEGVDWEELVAFEDIFESTQVREASWSKYDPETFDDTEEPNFLKNRKFTALTSPNFKRKSNQSGPKIDPIDDGIREPSVTKVIPNLGKFVFSGHFRDRLRQRKISPQDAIDAVANSFRKHMNVISSAKSPAEFICLSPDGLGVVMHKTEDIEGRTEYTLVTVHHKKSIPKDRDVIILREDDLLDKKTPTVNDLAAKYRVSAHDVLRELKKGIEIETEHTTKLDVAREIALDHLGEDLYYYVKLAKAEKAPTTAGDKNV